MSTRKRFEKYIGLEKVVVDKVLEITALGADITRVTKAADGETYDRVVVLKAGTEVKLEIQITEPDAWRRYEDVRLDLLSAFRHKEGSRFWGSTAIRPCSVAGFMDCIEVDRYGKLYECEADVLAFYVREPVDLLWLFSVSALQERRSYFLAEYGIKINRKSRDEKWESAFVTVHKTDIELDRCGVMYEPQDENEKGENSNE